MTLPIQQHSLMKSDRTADELIPRRYQVISLTHHSTFWTKYSTTQILTTFKRKYRAAGDKRNKLKAYLKIHPGPFELLLREPQYWWSQLCVVMCSKLLLEFDPGQRQFFIYTFFYKQSKVRLIHTYFQIKIVFSLSDTLSATLFRHSRHCWTPYIFE